MKRWILVAALVVVGLAVAGVLLALTLDEKPEPVAETRAAAVSTLPAVPTELFGADNQCGSLVYEGTGEPDLAIVYEAAIHSGGAGPTPRREFVETPRLVFGEHDWAAGRYAVGYFLCDDTVNMSGPNPCPPIGGAAQRELSVVVEVHGLYGTCNGLHLEARSRVTGRLAIVSATGTYDCFTQPSDSCPFDVPDPIDDPDRRSFLRLVAPDRVQAAGLVEFARSEGLRRIYVLDDREGYGAELAERFRRAATAAGIEIAGAGSWDPRARSYRDLMGRIKATHPDAVVLAGVVDENGAQVIRDKVAVLGPNDGAVRLLASGEFLTQATIDETGRAAEGLLAAGAGLSLSDLPTEGGAFVASLETESGRTLDRNDALRLAYTAAALEVALDAIARSDGTRAGVLDAIFDTQLEDGYTGPVGFDLYGDPTHRPIRIERAAAGEWLPYRTIEPDEALVQAASGAR